MIAPLFASYLNGVRGSLLRAAPLVVVLVVLAACSSERPQSTVSPGLDSGVTSSNGGGNRTIGSTPNVGVTTGSPGR